MENEPSEPAYWEAIADAAENIDFNAGLEKALDDFLELPHWLRLLMASDWCQKEICNGGLLQFFTNSTGMFAPEAVEGLRAMGLTECANLVEEGMRNRDNDPREEFGPRFPEEERSEWNPFYALDDKIFAELGHDGGRFEKAAQAFFLKHTRPNENSETSASYETN